MGLFDAIFPKRIRDPIRGMAHVVSSTAAPRSASSGNVHLTLVVHTEGSPPYSAQLDCMAWVSRWPHPGETLPVEVDREDPLRLRVVWDEVVKHRDRAQAEADAIARSMGGFGTFGTSAPGAPPGGDGAASVPGMSGVVVNVSGGTMDPAQVGDMLRMAESMTGMDLDGDGTVGAGPGAGAAAVPDAPSPPAPGGDDRLDRLERLAALRDRGVLSDAEFAAEKDRILGEG